MTKLILLFASAALVFGQNGTNVAPNSGNYPVDASTGVTINGCVKWNSTGSGLLNCGASDSPKLFFGIADANKSAGGGIALIHTGGPAVAAFDSGGATAGNAFGISATSPDFTDLGIAYTAATCANGALGIINQTVSGANPGNVTIKPCVGAGTVASGTAVLGTSAIASGACATVVTVSATGVLTTDVIVATPNADPTGVTGYAVSASGSLYIWVYPTANNMNVKVCNNTSGSLTPGALSLNLRDVR